MKQDKQDGGNSKRRISVVPHLSLPPDLASPGRQKKVAWETIALNRYSSLNLLASFPDPVIIIDPDTSIRYVNPALERMSGYSFEEVVGLKPPYPWWPTERVPKIIEGMKVALRVGASGLEQDFQRKDGGRFWVEVSSIPVRVGSEISYCVGRWVDITERKRGEDRLRETGRRYRQVAAHVTDVIWISDMDLNLTYVSPSIARLRGYDVEETMAQRVEEILTPASLEVMRKALARELTLERMREKDTSRSATLELQLTCRDGTTVWTEYKMAFLRDADSQPIGTLGISRDINERKLAEESIIQRSREITALHSVLMATTQTLDLNQVLKKIVSQVGAAVGSAYTRIVMAEHQRSLKVGGEDSGTRTPLPFDSQQRRIARRVIATGETLVVDDVSAEEVTNPVLAAGIKSYAVVPIRAKEATIGVMFVHSEQRGAFTDRTELLSAFASQAAIAIENARLYDTVKAERSRVERLLGQVLTAQEDERRRLSLELHDTITQPMYGVLAHIRAADELLSRSDLGQPRGELVHAKEALEQTLSELRKVAAGLHPPALDNLGLVKALRQYINKGNADNQGLICSFEVEGESRRLSSSMEIGIYRIVQEGLNNALKHAAATRADVRLRFLPASIILEISDDGRGFDSARETASKATEGHLGLVGMLERAELLGGTLRIRTCLGQGTRIEASFPSE